MHLTLIAFNPTALVEVSAEEIALLYECSALHYDGVCKRSTEQGELLYGMYNRLRYEPTAKIPLELRELDLILKITEVAHYLSPDKAEKVRCLGLDLSVIYKALLDKTPEPYQP